MFLNVSNHDSRLWSEEQLSSAVSLAGSVEDMPFPNVEPGADSERLDRMATDLFEGIRQRKPEVVHIMGELTLCHRVVNLLKREGIKTVASTTERDVTLSEDGVKTVRFRFVRFREY
jgi:hypothetical protein